MNLAPHSGVFASLCSSSSHEGNETVPSVVRITYALRECNGGRLESEIHESMRVVLALACSLALHLFVVVVLTYACKQRNFKVQRFTTPKLVAGWLYGPECCSMAWQIGRHCGAAQHWTRGSEPC